MGHGIDLDRLTPTWLREYADADPDAEDAPDRADAAIMRACADKIERLEGARSNARDHLEHVLGVNGAPGEAYFHATAALEALDHTEQGGDDARQE